MATSAKYARAASACLSEKSILFGQKDNIQIGSKKKAPLARGANLKITVQNSDTN
jgi:hypothetical protein